MLLYVRRDISEQKIEECGEDEGFVTVSKEDQRCRVVLGMMSERFLGQVTTLTQNRYEAKLITA